jgi:hypothetical protein
MLLCCILICCLHALKQTMARTQAVNQQKKAAAASNTTAATSTAPAAAAALRTSAAKRSPVKPRVTSDPPPKKAKIPTAPAADREKSTEKEIDQGQEIATGSGITAETDLFSEGPDINLEDFLMETEFEGKKNASADITPGTDLPIEKEGSSCSLAGSTYNLRTRREKQPSLDESDTDPEEEEKDESDEDSSDDVPKKPDATPPKIHQNVARLKGSGGRGRPIVPVSPSGTIELFFLIVLFNCSF